MGWVVVAGFVAFVILSPVIDFIYGLFTTQAYRDKVFYQVRQREQEQLIQKQARERQARERHHRWLMRTNPEYRAQARTEHRS